MRSWTDWHALPIAVALVGVVASSLAAWRVRASVEETRDHSFRRIAEELAVTIRETTRLDLGLAESLGAFFDASREVELDEFAAFESSLRSRRTSVRMTEWIPRVTAGARAAFEQDALRLGWDRFEIRDVGANGSAASADRDAYFPVLYVEPRGQFGGMRGVDIASIPGQRHVLDSYISEGQVALSPRLPPGLLGSDDAVVLAVHPVYEGGAPRRTRADRRVNFRGFAVAALAVRDIVAEAHTPTSEQWVRAAVFDLDEDPANAALFDGGGEPGRTDGASTASLAHEVAIDVGGRRWLIRCAATDAFLAEHATRRHWVLLGLGLLVTAILTGWLRSASGRAAEIEALVDRRTEELATSREAAERSATRLRLITDSAPVLIAYVDPEMRYRFVNRRYVELFGRASESIVGTPVREFVGVDAFAHVEPRMRRALAGEEVAFETEFVQPHGEMRTMRARYVPDRAADGHVRGVYAVIDDVTEQREATRAIERARDAALEAARVKSEFLSTMSHEIRTPLNAVIGASDLLLRTPLDSRQNDHTQTIRSSATTLLGLINDILDYSRLESGEVRVEKRPVDIRALLETVLDVVAPGAQVKSLELASVVDAGVPDRVLGDEHRIAQVLVNLLGNSVKFTDTGEVVIRVTPLSRDAGGNWVRFEVLDTGIGMTPADVERVLRPFVQADSSTTRTHGGSGLGLAITTRVVESLGGEIAVESSKGAGTTVRVDLPLSPLPHDGAPDWSAEEQGGVVWVLDDSEPTCEMLTVMLERAGRAARTTGDPAEVLEALRSASESHPIALIDVDSTVPLDDPWYAEVREACPDARLFALAGRQALPSELALRRAGIVSHLRKPVRSGTLLQRLGTAPDAEPIGDSRSEPLPRGGRILLVEDSPVNRRVTQAMLGSLGYVAEFATDGEQAVAAYEAEHYDLILMDRHMPRMDGVTATVEIRKRESERGGDRPRAAIVAMTADAFPEARAKCLAAGMDDFITKPVELAALRAVLERWLPA